ncbi:oxidoreductase [Desulfosarcina ovata subsp. sediminis]|uniref:Oxidoreductase n=2 Tax=Desulfosarcina ovata TaxID=83564 RepID=A0A5K7ZVE1_9BACT|nr:oxidoreductase [Desulfosarcina ovata subsp. sediminis]
MGNRAANMSGNDIRKIPFNYTSADDHQIIRLIIGEAGFGQLRKSRLLKRKGPALRPLLRFFGDLFMLRRNAFVRNELIESSRRRNQFFDAVRQDLAMAEKAAASGEPASTAVMDACRQSLAESEAGIRQIRDSQRRIVRRLAPLIGRRNIFTDPFSINAHVTDATNWRLSLPLAVARPTCEDQVPGTIRALSDAGFKVIPRGGGTGLTGGSVPLEAGCVVINTEQLNRIHGIETVSISTPDQKTRQVPVIHLEAGVITRAAMDAAKQQGLIFATDPTSAWACTIGGNIAENAGGKTAVLWGTAIDNLLAFSIAMPDGRLYTVKRSAHSLRRIRPEDRIRFDVLDDTGHRVREVNLDGLDVRKAGLGKDITNKALSGLPGVQKEGTDGIITSARFILHRAYPRQATCCLEFFGEDMDEASRAIAAICNAFANRGEETLMALEHFDDAYVRAIGYKVKAPRQDPPKAVLLVDMVGHDDQQIRRGLDRLAQLMAAYANTHLFVAENEQEAERYWRDRKRLGAIARRTRSFKLNEDIVLPIHALAEFAQFADDINAEEQRENQRDLVFRLGAHLETAQPLEDPEWLAAKRPAAKTLLMETLERIRLAGKHHLQEETHIRQLRGELTELFSGYVKINHEIDDIVADTRSKLIVIATHMHAGDGNIHVNIPVFANDREMMIRAAETADAVMAKAIELNGVVSGEHGIGFTKFKYLDESRIDALADYRRQVDPDGIMNPGKLSDPRAPQLVFAPSFNLLELEASILRHAELERLAEMISGCVRCGRCKTPCCVFHPQENLFFHPRNKNLAVVALIEAILWETQRFRSTGFNALKYLGQVADHCTICHKCQPPCPVDIDSGAVSILERRILTARRYRHTAAPTALALAYLDNRSKTANAILRPTALWAGSRMQRSAAWLLNRLPGGATTIRAAGLDLLRAPMPPVPAGTLFGRLPACGRHQAVVVEPEEPARGTVFYFPGCGSERMIARIGLAAIHILVHTGLRVILPPPFLCCSFPAQVNAKADMHRRQAMRTAVILSQIRERFGHLTFDAVAVSCGTCREALAGMQAEAIFGCPLTDVSRLALERGLNAAIPGPCLYHAPCHDSLDGTADTLLGSLGHPVSVVPHCCGEAGTLALSRPDIAAAMRARKADAFRPLLADTPTRSTIVLTNCPSCLTGLGRNQNLGFSVRHLTEELAIGTDGSAWLKKARAWLARAVVVTI